MDNFHHLLHLSANAKCICAVGAGGKTSLLYQLAKESLSLGKKVLLTTTTKMYLPQAFGYMDASAKELRRSFKDQPFLIAGTKRTDGKFGPLPKDVWDEIYEIPDVILVEADGSRQLPVKYPASYEPALPEKWDEVIVIMGLSALGQPLKNVCHRSSLAANALGWEDQHLFTAADLITLTQKGYGHLLKAQKSRLYLNQTDTLTPQTEKELANVLSAACHLFSVQTGSLR